MILEICCGSADDVIRAWKGGAHRVELNSNLFHGGLTPTVGSLRVAKQAADIPIMAMVRPREGGFCYTEAEFLTAVEDAKLLLENGADGLVFGFLHADGRVDKERTAILAKLAQDAGKETVFHRAIDVVPDWKEALDILIELGITRVLTSGQESDVPWGAPTIREMVAYADGRIEILPGGGIRLRNVERVIQETGCNQVHMSAGQTCIDSSAMNNRNIHFGGCLYPPEDVYRTTNSDTVASVAAVLNTL